jgi:hypothetical protein
MQVHMDLMDWGAAIQDMSSALALITDCASLHYSRGMAFFSLHDDEAALAVSGDVVEPVTGSCLLATV